MSQERNSFVDFVAKNRTMEQAEKIFQQRLDDAREIYEEFSL